MNSISEKQSIKLFFCDFWADFNLHNNFIIDTLKETFTLTIDKENPDFLFCSCFGKDHLNYTCTKIFFTGENITPDFNVYDYAIGFDFLNFEDRYLRFPLFKLYMQDKDCQEHDQDFFIEECAAKSGFCNFIYSNSVQADPCREEFFHKLMEYKHVDSGGKYLNNIGHFVDDKIAWQRQYKFSIAFENSSKNGYSTEKLYDALRAHTIPIYWGNAKVSEDFNPKRFINCQDFSSFHDVIEYVKKLDNDDALYMKTLCEPWFMDKTPLEVKNDPSLKIFLVHILMQNAAQTKRVTPHGHTAVFLKEQRMIQDAYFLKKYSNFLFKIKQLKQRI